MLSVLVPVSNVYIEIQVNNIDGFLQVLLSTSLPFLNT